MANEKKYPKGHWMGIGIAIGIPIGTALFFIADLLTGEFGSMFFLGPGVGVAIGVSIGAALEERYKKRGQIRELTLQEEKRRRKLVNIGLLILVLGAVAGIVAMLGYL
jgi:hypothetical protein